MAGLWESRIVVGGDAQADNTNSAKTTEAVVMTFQRGN